RQISVPHKCLVQPGGSGCRDKVGEEVGQGNGQAEVFAGSLQREIAVGHHSPLRGPTGSARGADSWPDQGEEAVVIAWNTARIAPRLAMSYSRRSNPIMAPSRLRNCQRSPVVTQP